MIGMLGTSKLQYALLLLLRLALSEGLVPEGTDTSAAASVIYQLARSAVGMLVLQAPVQHLTPIHYLIHIGLKML